MCDTETGVPFTSSVVLKQRNAKDAKTSVVECYTGGVNCAGGDDSVGALSGGRSATQRSPSQALSIYSDSRTKKGAKGISTVYNGWSATSLA